jgi:hypothetical protein
MASFPPIHSRYAGTVRFGAILFLRSADQKNFLLKNKFIMCDNNFDFDHQNNFVYVNVNKIIYVFSFLKINDGEDVEEFNQNVNLLRKFNAYSIRRTVSGLVIYLLTGYKSEALVAAKCIERQLFFSKK